MSTAWTNQVTSLIILTEQSTGFSGLFGYSPSAGAGNLIFSIAAVSGTDPYGNAYQSGITDYSGANIWAQLQAGVINLNGAAGQFQTGQLGTSGSGTTFLSSGLETNTDSGAEVITQSATAAGGSSTVTISAADFQVNHNAVISGTLTVNGTDLGGLVASIVAALSGQATSTNGLTDGTINGSSSTAGLPNGGINGTSGGASAGTAHTHGGGSYAVTSGQHSHGGGSYAVTNGQHDHTLPTVL